jgi:hypothetical protein
VRRNLTCLLLAVVPTLTSCSPSPEFEPGARVASPNGWAEAYVLEWSYGPDNGRTQVMLSFDGGMCGRGSVSANGTSLGLELRWVEPTTLQVTYPESVDLEQPAGGGEDMQCGKRKVKVILSASTSGA